MERWKHCDYPNHHKHITAEDGEWVRHDDHTAEIDRLQSEVERLNNALNCLRENCNEMSSQSTGYVLEINELFHALSSARNDALEEAAVLVRRRGRGSSLYESAAAAIRALKTD